MIALDKQRADATSIAAAARPAQTSALPTADPAIAGTPVPPGVIPANEQVIEQLAPETLAGGPAVFRRATSVWRVGAVLTAALDDYNPFFVYTDAGKDDGYPVLGAYVLNGTEDQSERYDHTWLCPRKVGAITITGVTGPTGIVSLKTATGQVGSFDLATQTWSFSQ